MIGVGPFELGLGLCLAALAALIVYFVFRDQVSSLGLVLLVVVLAPILAVFLAYAQYALLGS